MLISGKERVGNDGCPVGSLSQEVHKSIGCHTDVLPDALKDHHGWLSEQFRLMGKKDADALAGQFFSIIQGACLLASSFNDPEIFVEQGERLKDWVKSL
ncbi:hypothetical protein [Syntrophotalea acetylenivorans]|nr:hypothetical protein [Syntrophotalea acetylenivorans]